MGDFAPYGTKVDNISLGKKAGADDIVPYIAAPAQVSLRNELATLPIYYSIPRLSSTLSCIVSCLHRL